MENSSLYSPASFFLVRKPLFAIDEFFRMFEKGEELFDDLMALYESDPLLKEAIQLASSSLIESMEQKSHSQNVMYSLLKYFIRMSSRSTPFGLFSSVSLGNWGEVCFSVLDHGKLEQRKRPDMEWLSGVIDEICNTPRFFSSLLVQQNPLVQKIASRFTTSYFRKTEERKTISIRRLPLTDAIFKIAQKPVAIHDLIDQVLTALPHLEKSKIEGVIKSLLERHFLWFSLAPSLLTTSPLEDFLEKLTPEQFSFFTEKQKEQKLQVDTFERGRTVTLPLCVREEVAKAAKALARISFYEDVLSLEGYRNRFIAKYGLNRTVPLLELLSEESGLGIPDIYSSFMKEKKVPLAEGEFRKLLSREYARCLHEGKYEIDVSEMTLPEEPSKLLQPSIDLYVEVIADSAEAVESGDFLLLITNQTWQGGSTFGRFLDLFDESFQREFKEMIQREESLDPEVEFIESSHLPLGIHAQNVGVHPSFRKQVLDLTAAGRSSYTLEEIFVGSFHDRFFLTSADGKKEVYVTSGNVLNPEYAPIPLRFLRDVSKSRYRLVSPFYWIGMGEMPFLPRVIAKKVILSPAQWNLKEKHLGKSTFSAWADSWKVPKYIYLTLGDQRLLLDRHSPVAIKIIQRELKKGGSIQLTEKVGQEKGQWMKSERGSHVAEFVFPLLRDAKNVQNRKRPAHVQIPSSSRWKLPGSEWLYAMIYLSSEGEGRFLIEQLAPFSDYLMEQGMVKQWFFVRYAESRDHIRVRFQGDPPTLTSAVLPLLEQWSSKALQEGSIQEISLGSYEREIERYGGLSFIDQAETFFCFDSQTALALLRESCSFPDYIVGALSIIDLLPGELEERLHFFATRGVDKSELKDFRKWKVPILSLADAILKGTLFESEPKLFNAFKIRKEALLSFYAQVEGEERLSILDSFIHMHCNRLFGIDAKLEKKARAHAFHALHVLHAGLLTASAQKV